MFQICITKILYGTNCDCMAHCEFVLFSCLSVNIQCRNWHRDVKWCSILLNRIVVKEYFLVLFFKYITISS